MINLFVGYYQCGNPVRQKELDHCLARNVTNKLLNAIVLETPERLKFNFFFNKINKITSDNDINIIANSDIYFDETIQLTAGMTHNDCYALSRWDVTRAGTAAHMDRRDSQDVWIVRGKVRNVFGDFYLGYRGCDNRIAYEFQKAGYVVRNPSKTIKTYHLHLSNIRSYNMSNVVSEPYLTVQPTIL